MLLKELVSLLRELKTENFRAIEGYENISQVNLKRIVSTM